MLVKPSGSLMIYDMDEGGKSSDAALIFKRAIEEKKLICSFVRKGKEHYRLYDPNRKPTEKELEARMKFVAWVRERAAKRKWEYEHPDAAFKPMTADAKPEEKKEEQPKEQEATP